MLSLGQPAVQPFGHSEEAFDCRAEHQLVLAEIRSSALAKLRGGLRLAAKLRGVAALQREHRRHVDQQAARPARRGLERLVISRLCHLLCSVEQWLDGLEVARMLAI